VLWLLCIDVSEDLSHLDLACRQRLVVDDGGERKRTTSFNTDASANGGVSAANSLKTSCMQRKGVVSGFINLAFPKRV
jgi:hypothetical protein